MKCAKQEVSNVTRTPLLISLLLLVSATSCAPEAPHADELEDDTGAVVEVPERDARVLPLAPSLTELVAAVGGIDRLAGVSQADDFPPEVESLDTFSSYPLSIESVARLQPDLALAAVGVNSPDNVAALEEIGIPTYRFSFERVEDVPHAMRVLDTLLQTTKGTRLASEFERRLQDVRARTANALPVRTLLLIGVEGLYAFGRDSYASEAVRLAGGANLTDPFSGAAAQLSPEAVIEMAPATIIVATTGNAREEVLETHPTFSTLPAVESGRVYSIDPNLILRPGPRLIDGIEALSRRLHPELTAPEPA